MNLRLAEHQTLVNSHFAARRARRNSDGKQAICGSFGDGCDVKWCARGLIGRVVANLSGDLKGALVGIGNIERSVATLEWTAAKVCLEPNLHDAAPWTNVCLTTNVPCSFLTAVSEYHEVLAWNKQEHSNSAKGIEIA